MAARTLFLTSLLLGLASAQKPGSSLDNHPVVTTHKCTNAGGCKPLKSKLVLDSLSHWVHQKADQSKGCGDWGNGPPADVCPDVATCQENCIMEGIADYSTYGVTTNDSTIRLRMLRDDGSVASPRIYLLSEDTNTYEMLHLTGQELSFDVDGSKLPCGMNAALYLSEMEPRGGQDQNKGTTVGGAPWGTGYCDAQCFTTPFVNGVGNIGKKGSCCNELDIWEANSRATHLAPHTCNQTGLYQCTGGECAFEGVCDKNGCGYNPYAVGNPGYYGRTNATAKFTIDTTRKFTVVTQFPTDEAGKLKEIHRLYIQDGRVIRNAPVKIDGPPKIDYMNDAFCQATGARRYRDLGATKGMGEAMSRGMVLIFSLWWDQGGGMTWLDAGARGPCQPGEGKPSHIVTVERDPVVEFSAIKWGDIGTTFKPKCKTRRG